MSKSKFHIDFESGADIQCLSIRTNSLSFMKDDDTKYVESQELVSEAEFHKFIAYVAPLVREYNTGSTRFKTFRERINAKYIDLFKEEDLNSRFLEKPGSPNFDGQRSWFIYFERKYHDVVLNVLQKAITDYENLLAAAAVNVA